ncbi:MAG: hypothetical protein ACKVS7_16450 [Gemmatimonadaceae bacterium]
MLVSTKWILLALTVAGGIASSVGTVAIDLEVTVAKTGAAVPHVLVCLDAKPGKRDDWVVTGPDGAVRIMNIEPDYRQLRLQAPGYRSRNIALRYETDTLRIKTTLVADSTVKASPRCD